MRIMATNDNDCKYPIHRSPQEEPGCHHSTNLANSCTIRLIRPYQRLATSAIIMHYAYLAVGWLFGSYSVYRSYLVQVPQLEIFTHDEAKYISFELTS
jgi:hypothetical protein